MPNRPHSSPAVEQYELLARHAAGMLTWQWFPNLDIFTTRDARSAIPRLMIALYSGHQEDRRLTRGEACTIMEVDMATTGPRFIAMLENADLVEIERYPEHDKRKEFIKPTVRLVRAVETELRRLAVGIINCAEHFQSLEFLKGMDKSTLNKVPSGGPGPEPALVPAQWPPVDKGTPFKNGRPPPRRPRG